MITITPATLRRWYCYDFAEGAEPIRQLLELLPVDKDGLATELEQHVHRVNHVKFMAPLITDYAGFAGRVTAAVNDTYISTFLASNPEPDLETFVGFKIAIQQSLVYSTLVAFCAALGQLELINDNVTISQQGEDEE